MKAFSLRVENVQFFMAGIRELKQATFLNHGQTPEVNISHARLLVSPRFLNLSSLY